MRFYDNLTREQFGNIAYDNIIFRGLGILKQKEEAFKNQLIASSFSAWQILSAKGVIKDDWKSYLVRLNLADTEDIQEGQLKQEYEQGMRNAQKIIEKAKRKKSQNGV